MAKARAPSREPTAVGPRCLMLLKTIVTVLLVLLIMIGLTILIIWLSIKPKRPIYKITSASIHDYNLSKDHHLNASYNFVLWSDNPNKKMHIRYKKTEIKVMFENETIASGVIDPWHQHKGEKRRFNLDLASRNVELFGALSQHMELAKSAGQIVVDVKLKGRIRAKLGVWKSKYYHMKVSCVHVLVRLSNSSKEPKWRWCDVDI